MNVAFWLAEAGPVVAVNVRVAANTLDSVVVAAPPAPVMAVGGTKRSLASLLEKTTFAPCTRLPKASAKVASMLMAKPASVDGGEMTSEEAWLFASPATNNTEAEQDAPPSRLALTCLSCATCECSVVVKVPLPSVMPLACAKLLSVPVATRLTGLLAMGLLKASRTSTVAHVVAMPSATRSLGEKFRLDVPLLAGPTANPMDVVRVVGPLDAETMRLPANVEPAITAYVPVASVTPLAPPPRLLGPGSAMVTARSATGLLKASRNTAVMVASLMPSAGTDVGDTTSEEAAALASPATKSREAVTNALRSPR